MNKIPGESTKSMVSTSYFYKNEVYTRLCELKAKLWDNPKVDVFFDRNSSNPHAKQPAKEGFLYRMSEIMKEIHLKSRLKGLNIQRFLDVGCAPGLNN